MSIRVFGSMEINDSSPDIQLTIFVIKSAFPSDDKNSFEEGFSRAYNDYSLHPVLHVSFEGSYD